MRFMRPHAQAVPARGGARRRATRAVALALLACLAGAAAHAQVYSWRDPQSGQLRISTVPPPWLRDRGAAAAGPRVHVYKDGKVVPPDRVGAGGRVLEPEPAAGAGDAGAAAQKTESVPGLLAQLSALQSQLVSDALRVGPAAANQAYFEKLDAYVALCERADAADPAGAGARSADRNLGMQRMKANIEGVLRDPAQRADFQSEATRWLSRRSDLAAQRFVRCLRDGLC